jgi:hypothetical protein
MSEVKNTSPSVSCRRLRTDPDHDRRKRTPSSWRRSAVALVVTLCATTAPTSAGIASAAASPRGTTQAPSQSVQRHYLVALEAVSPIPEVHPSPDPQPSDPSGPSVLPSAAGGGSSGSSSNWLLYVGGGVVILVMIGAWSARKE